MANIREILTHWTLPSGGNHVTVMWFDAATAVATQRTALHAFLTATKAFQATAVNYSIDTAGREVDSATGTLTGAWSEVSSKTGAGTGGATPLADSTQALVQWRSPTVYNGRFVRGRTFLPGFSTSQLSSGNVASAAIAGVNAAGATFIASGGPPVVWHRPVSGSGGFVVTVTGVSTWSEFAVLRRRRG